MLQEASSCKGHGKLSFTRYRNFNTYAMRAVIDFGSTLRKRIGPSGGFPLSSEWELG